MMSELNDSRKTKTVPLMSIYFQMCKNLNDNSLEFVRNRDEHDFNIRDEDNFRLPKVKRNWGRQRTCYQAILD